MDAKQMEEMKAGRDLDARIAVKVMGWTYQHDLAQCPNQEARRCQKCGAVVWNSEQTVAPCTGFSKYSTAIEAAWEVFEKIGPGWQISQSDFAGYSSKERWWVWLPEDMGGDGSTIMAETAPLAICLAALMDFER